MATLFSVHTPRLDGPVRLPLSVGTGALLSWSRTVMGLGTIAALVAFLFWVEVNTFGPFLLAALAVLFIVLFTIFVAQNARRALERGASDVLLDANGITVSGGRADGLVLPWSEVTPPGASLEQLEDKRVTVAGMLGSVAMGILALIASGGEQGAPRPSAGDLDPNADVGKWVLTLHGITPKVVAESDDASEARSFKSARSSIVALVEGRTDVATQAAVARDFLACPSCKAPQVLQDAESLPCPFCGATVPVSEAFRAQARSVSALGESFERTRSTVARLRAQPLGHQVALVTNTLALVMLLSFVGCWLAAWQMKGQLAVVLFPLPVAVVGLSYSLTRAWLAGRAALRMLSLGYGALAPEQTGKPARCRRCLGPLPASPAGAVVRCGYCSTDNVMGIDLRPVVHATRSAEETLEPMLQHLARERRTAFVLAGVTLALTAGWLGLHLS